MYDLFGAFADPPIDISFVKSPHDGPLTNVSLCHAESARSRIRRRRRRRRDLGLRAVVLNHSEVPVVALLMPEHDEVVGHGRGLVRNHERLGQRCRLPWRRFGEVDVIDIRDRPPERVCFVARPLSQRRLRRIRRDWQAWFSSNLLGSGALNIKPEAADVLLACPERWCGLTVSRMS